jgi:hypothetical protein
MATENNSPPSVDIVKDIITETKQGLQCFIRGLPICLFIPTYLFFINPSTENGIFAGGAFISFIFGISFASSAEIANNTTKNLPKAFLGNSISLYGLTIGYIGGYKMLEGVFNDKLGNVLGSFLLTLILAIIVSWGLHIDDLSNVPSEIASTFLAISIGGAIGGYTAYMVRYLNKKKNKNKKDSTILCKAYKNGTLVDLPTDYNETPDTQ